MARLLKPSIREGSKTLGLPPSNLLIPKNFSLKREDPENSKSPQLVKQWADTELWFHKDDKFKRPKCKISAKLYTNDCNMGASPSSRVFVHVWTKVLKEYMREFNYMANCANLTFGVSP